jgi:hypothetical protein
VAPLVLLATGLMWAGCGGSSGVKVDASGLPTNQAVTQRELLGFPETHLYYPGSTVVRKVGASQTPTHPGEEPNPAYSGAILTARTSAASLYTWYDNALTARGYTSAADYRPSSQTSGRAWQLHHRLQVQVGIFDPAALDSGLRMAGPVPAGTVVYEEILVGYPPGLPKL